MKRFAMLGATALIAMLPSFASARDRGGFFFGFNLGAVGFGFADHGYRSCGPAFGFACAPAYTYCAPAYSYCPPPVVYTPPPVVVAAPPVVYAQAPVVYYSTPVVYSAPVYQYPVRGYYYSVPVRTYGYGNDYYRR
jgi:hypothetical protein